MNSGVLCGIDYESPLVKYRGERVAKLAELLAGEHLKIDYVVSADVFYAFYLPAPVLRSNAETTITGQLVSLILTSRTGLLLRSRTVLDVFSSYLASAVFLSEYYRSERCRTGNEGFRELPAKDDVERALAEAYREVETVNKVRALVTGLQPGTSSIYSVEDYTLDLLRLAREADVKEVIRYLEGVRYGDVVPSRKYRRSKRGEKLGYTLGSDIERLVPRSLSYPPELFYVKLVEGRLLLYDKGVPRTAGPVYVLLDKSGSMEGEKILWAKAVALALYAKTVKSGRVFYARFFDSQPHQLVSVKRPYKPHDALKAFEYLARVKSAGGTDITRALQTAISDLELEKAEDATIVLVTDGIDRVAERPLETRLKRIRARLVTVMVKGDNQSLRRLSTAYLAVTKLSGKSVLKVVKAVD